MYSIAFLAFSAFALCYALTPVVASWSRRRGILDRPGIRHTHPAPTPRTGGIAIAMAYTVPIGILVVSPLNAADSINLPAVVRLLPAALAVFVIGLLDDLFGLKPWEKLVGQTLAACIAYVGGVQFSSAAGHAIPHIWALPLTVVWLLACANAFNLIDGVDGLATGVSLFAAFTTLFAALVQGNAPLGLATAPLVGALAAFLIYNWNPASIFLGDCGSLTIGFVLGCFGAIWMQKSATALGMTAPVMAMALPLVDTSVAILRRFLRRQPVFSADRNHIHHRLLARGMSHRQVVVVLYAVCCIGAAFSLLVTVPGNNFAGLLLVTFCLVVWGGVRLLGYSELDLAQQMVMTGVFRQVLGARLFVKSIEERCAKALNADDFWAVVQDVAAELKCVHVRMSLLGAEYERCAEAGQPGACFSIQIPLSAGDYVSFRYPVSRSMRQAVAMASIVEILQGAVTLEADAAGATALEPRGPIGMFASEADEGTLGFEVVRAPEPRVRLTPRPELGEVRG